ARRRGRQLWRPADELAGDADRPVQGRRAGGEHLEPVSHNYMSVYHDYLQQEYGAKPHVDGIVDMLWQRSAIRFVNRVRTPVMFIHGDNDQLVNPAEIEQFFIALKDVGVETVIVRYPREGHGMRENGHIADVITRSLAWYDKHFAAAAPRSTN